MKCAGCSRNLEVGDLYIKDDVNGFLGLNVDSEINELTSSFLGGVDGKIFYCESCTEPGGDYVFEIFNGDEAE